MLRSLGNPPLPLVGDGRLPPKRRVFSRWLLPHKGVNSPTRTRHRLLGLKVLSVGPKTLSFTLNVPMLGS